MRDLLGGRRTLPTGLGVFRTGRLRGHAVMSLATGGTVALSVVAIAVTMQDFVLLVGGSIWTPATIAATQWTAALLLLLVLITSVALRRHRTPGGAPLGDVLLALGGLALLAVVLGSGVWTAAALALKASPISLSGTTLTVIPGSRGGPCDLVAAETKGLLDGDVRVYPLNLYGVGLGTTAITERFNKPATAISDGDYTLQPVHEHGDRATGWQLRFTTPQALAPGELRIPCPRPR